LTVTGNSVIGDIRTDVHDLRTTSCAMQSEVTQMRVSLTAIERALSASSPAIQIALSSGQSNGMAPPVAPISSTELASVQHHLNIIHEELIGVKRRLESDAAVTFSSGPTEAMPRRCVPVFYLSNSFKLSVCGGGGGVWRGSYLRPILRPASSCPDSPQGSGVSGPPTWLSTSPSQDVSIRPAYDACNLRKHLQFVPRNFGAIR
jgi:hypothetical protein